VLNKHFGKIDVSKFTTLEAFSDFRRAAIRFVKARTVSFLRISLQTNYLVRVDAGMTSTYVENLNQVT
jgi:hypothetical protein